MVSALRGAEQTLRHAGGQKTVSRPRIEVTMKIVLDIDKLLEDGLITSHEYERLKRFSLKETGSLAFNILIGFGVIATAGGALALVPSSLTAIVLGTLLAVAGIVLALNMANEWGLLGSILLLVGSVIAAGGIIALSEGGAIGYLIVTVVCAFVAVFAKSSLLSIMAALALSATVGAMTAYAIAQDFRTAAGRLFTPLVPGRFRFRIGRGTCSRVSGGDARYCKTFRCI